MIVRETEGMEPADFARHMSLRHNEAGELGGQTTLSERSARVDRKAWEAYHKRLHDVREYEHAHE